MFVLGKVFLEREGSTKSLRKRFFDGLFHLPMLAPLSSSFFLSLLVFAFLHFTHSDSQRSGSMGGCVPELERAIPRGAGREQRLHRIRKSKRARERPRRESRRGKKENSGRLESCADSLSLNEENKEEQSKAPAFLLLPCERERERDFPRPSPLWCAFRLFASARDPALASPTVNTKGLQKPGTGTAVEG